MYLKALELQGFKSFPDRTVLHFDKEITAIVGPNGSGKSNISDAILWVMGEQRSRALRGGKMEDVVFGGTEKRSPMGFAQVSLILDNSAGLFDLDAPEVVITRRYYRSGESEYSLNRESVRLRDVVSLLMDTGLGRDGYSVIGQGRIAEIVSARSTDRREIFEEAAGIARYRSRKEEAERKLERTEDNLVRINDKIGELENQVTPLKKQAETAKKYLILRDEQRVLEISLWMDSLDRLAGETQKLSGEFAEAQGNLERAKGELDRLYAAAERFGEEMRRCDLRGEDIQHQAEAEDALAAESESAAAVLRAGAENHRENIARMREEVHADAGRRERLEAQKAEQEARSRDLAGALEQNRSEAEALRRETEREAALAGEARTGLAELVARESAASAALMGCDTTLGMLANRRDELKARLEGADAERESAGARYQSVCASLGEAEKEYEAAKTRADEIRNVLNGHRMLMGSREQAVRDLTAEKNRLTVEKRSAEARAKLLGDMEKEYEGLGKAVKSVMLSASRGALRGIRGPVAKLIDVPDRYTVAIETALGAALQNIVTETQDAGKAAIEFLKRTDGGRATFLPMDTLRPSFLQHVPEGEPGYLGVAAGLVNCAEEYQSVVGNLLGRTVVAETLGDAVRMSRRNRNQLRIVTLDGQMINAGGSMTGGSAARNVGILSRANELRALRLRLTELEEQEKGAADKLAEAERVLSGARYESRVAESQLAEATALLHKKETDAGQYRLLRDTLDETLETMERDKAALEREARENAQRKDEQLARRSELDRALADLQASIAEATRGQEDLERRLQARSEAASALREQAAALESERDAALRSARDLGELIASLLGDASQRESTIAQLEARCAALAGEIEQKRQDAAGHREKAEAHRAELAAVRQEKLELEGRRTRSDREAQDKNREILDLQGACSRLEQKKLSAELEEKQLIDKLWESYELSRTAAQQQRRPLEDRAAASKRATELRREIGRLGHVNVGAIEEYERVSERYEFLSSQRDDVESAKRDLLKIIAEITGEMKEIFLREFAAIEESFRTIFLELFGGGKAALELEDPEDPLNCGIEIRVQPPGKAVTTISLLSGGEKSFVAICLYFAIMRVRPTPFCIMDEIDAALDEANVERYARYMRTLSDKTQFITITHHRATMEEADMLYGVTMQEKGVTTVLSIDLEEAEKTIG